MAVEQVEGTFTSSQDQTELQLNDRTIDLARWLGWCIIPYTKKVTGSIPSQGTYLGCGFDPRWGRVWEATDHCFSLRLPSSLSEINKSITN